MSSFIIRNSLNFSIDSENSLKSRINLFWGKCQILRTWHQKGVQSIKFSSKTKCRSFWLKIFFSPELFIEKERESFQMYSLLNFHYWNKTSVGSVRVFLFPLKNFNFDSVSILLFFGKLFLIRSEWILITDYSRIR